MRHNIRNTESRTETMTGTCLEEQMCRSVRWGLCHIKHFSFSTLHTFKKQPPNSSAAYTIPCVLKYSKGLILATSTGGDGPYPVLLL